MGLTAHALLVHLRPLLHSLRRQIMSLVLLLRSN